MSDPLSHKDPGESLDPKEASSLGELVSSLLSAAQKSQPEGPRSKERLREALGAFLADVGWEATYEEEFLVKGPHPERTVFDVVGRHHEETLHLLCMQRLTGEDMETLHTAADQLRIGGEKGTLTLGTDLLNYPDLVTGSVGSAVKDLMEEAQMGLLLAGPGLVLVFENWRQLNLEQMPTFWAPESDGEGTA